MDAIVTGIVTLAVGLLGGWLAGRQRRTERREEEWIRRREGSAAALARARLLLADVRIQGLLWTPQEEEAATAAGRALDSRRNEIVEALTSEAFAHPSPAARKALDVLVSTLTKAVNTGWANMMASARGSDTASREEALEASLGDAEEALEEAADAIRARPQD